MKTTDDYYKIVTENLPLIDVRAPIEFAKGSIKHAVNLPILEDDERHLVGIKYKTDGNDAATELGHAIVSGDNRKKRIDQWIAFLNEHPQAMLYCFRGGSRSRIAQSWIEEASGKTVPRIKGGYKAFRNYLMNVLNEDAHTATPIVLKGYTGSGKTAIIRQMPFGIDLEGIANHRGSSFGDRLSPQPTQVNFEVALAYAILHHRHQNHAFMLLEDEGRHVGKRFIPRNLVNYFYSGKSIVLEVPFESRVNHVLEDYVTEAIEAYQLHDGEELGFTKWKAHIIESLNKAKKRLGDERHGRLLHRFEHACAKHLATGEVAYHTQWIAPLLDEYYDPMYRYQMGKSKEDPLFVGNPQEVIDYLQSLNNEREA